VIKFWAVDCNGQKKWVLVVKSQIKHFKFKRFCALISIGLPLQVLRNQIQHNINHLGQWPLKKSSTILAWRYQLLTIFTNAHYRILSLVFQKGECFYLMNICEILHGCFKEQPF
jgi:hypothetical protein